MLLGLSRRYCEPEGRGNIMGARAIAGMTINRERYLLLGFFVDYNQHVVYLWVFHQLHMPNQSVAA